MRSQQIEIRKASPGDLYGLVRALDQREFFIDRLQRQHAGRGELITAWSGGQALGVVYLWLELADEAEISEHLPGVPLLTHLEVAEPYRNHQIGTMLINTTERKVLALRYTKLALAVERGNQDAERLYRRLGYVGWERGSVRCRDEFRNRTEICNVLVKTLTGSTQHRAPAHEKALVRW